MFLFTFFSLESLCRTHGVRQSEFLVKDIVLILTQLYFAATINVCHNVTYGVWCCTAKLAGMAAQEVRLGTVCVRRARC